MTTMQAATTTPSTTLWQRQVRAIAALELRKTLWSPRALPIYLLMLIPVGMMVLYAMVSLLVDDGDIPGINSAPLVYAGIYQFILRGFIYIGCVWTFMNLFRGEVLDRSLHYYFLCPIRREVLVAGKFVAGWLSTSVLFVMCTLLTFGLFYSVYGPAAVSDQLLGGPALGHLISYVGVTVLACLGYGAVFLVVGLFFKNPIIPAVLIWVWEVISSFMPALLKKVSVIFYLRSLFPVDLPASPFSVVAEPVSAWLSIPGFLIFTGVTLFAASLKIRKMEIAYAAD